MTDIELVISANGCTDNTRQYLDYLHSTQLNIKEVWHDAAMGFAKATNAGILSASGQKVVLLNNDTVLLAQPQNSWLERLDQGDISAVLTLPSSITKRRFAVFFCVMIQRRVLDAVGLLSEEFPVGGCEDIDYCARAQNAGFEIVDIGYNRDFPIYHAAEGTMNDDTLVQNWKETFQQNEEILARKYA
jgi:GT2 family glycosyltransferase